MTKSEASYSCCERVHVLLQELNGLVDSSWDGGEDHVQAGLRAETRGHLDHRVWMEQRPTWMKIKTLFFFFFLLNLLSSH